MKPRLIALKNVYNSRDLAGYPTTDGHHIKAGRLFRTALLHNLDDQELNTLHQLNVTRVIDFRDDAEISHLPDHLTATIHYLHLPVFKEDETSASLSTSKPLERFAIDYNVGRLWMLKAYHDMVTIDSAKSAYREFFCQLLSANENEATIFHCTAGKDRTGMAAYFLMRALGVAPEVAAQDYLWTNVYSADRVRMRIDSVKAHGGNEVVIYNVRQMSAALPEYLQQATKLINAHYGDMAHFISEFLGLSADDIADLRRLYLVD